MFGMHIESVAKLANYCIKSSEGNIGGLCAGFDVGLS